MTTLNTKGLIASTDRVIKLAPIDGTKPKNAMGQVDPKIFTGENNLHAIRDEETCHWYLKYDNGGLPEGLRQRWTSLKMLLNTVEIYFKNRNIKITEVIN